MAPVFAVLASPFTRVHRVSLVLWFTHWHASRTLRLAERVSTAVTSVDRRSFPLPSTKVRAIGHGIDLREFPCAERRQGDRLRLLALGRYSQAKGLDVIVRALAGADVDAELVLHGPTLNEAELVHLGELERLVRTLGVDDRVRLGGPVARADVPRLLAGADVLVNNMRSGAPDKVVYEAGASCLPVIASNPVFDTFLEPQLRFNREDPADLARRLESFARLNGDDRAALGRALHEKVALEHSVESWAEGILEACESE
jgi:glycosyltransferase involved in cell wall biosynthesis